MKLVMAKHTILGGVCILLSGIMACNSNNTKNSHGSAAAKADAWDSLPAIAAQIKAPEFPNKDFSIMQYGAKNDSTFNSSAAFKKAIEACNQQGGGRVIVPAGVYFTGPVYLKSNVNLHLEKGARIVFSTNPNDYLPLVHGRWEGVELMNYSSLIYAYQEKNIAITGEGILDGKATFDNWWPWKGGKGWKKGAPNQNDSGNRPALFKMNDNGVPVEDRKFGNGFYLRPQFFQPYQCNNILVEGVTFTNSPMWNLTPCLCNNITIRKVTIEAHGPNTDGCDPESCKNVLIQDCLFNTGDDCIAIKSGRNADGRKFNTPSENIIIQGCTMIDGHGGVAIGSEISGGVRNVFIENCKMSSPNLDVALRIKSSAERGGTTENIYMRNVEVGQVAHQFVIATMNYKNETGNFVPAMRNIAVKNVTVHKGGEIGVFLDGYKDSPVDNFSMSNVTIDSVPTPYKFVNAVNTQFDNVTINGKKVAL